MIAQGSRLRVYVENPSNPGSFLRVASCISTDITYSAGSIDVTKQEGGRFRRIIPGGVKSVSISVSGVFTDDITMSWIREKCWHCRVARFKIVDQLGNTIQSDFLCSTFSSSGPVFKEQTYSFKLDSTTRPYFYSPVLGASGKIPRPVGPPEVGTFPVPPYASEWATPPVVGPGPTVSVPGSGSMLGLPTPPPYVLDEFTDVGTYIGGHSPYQQSTGTVMMCVGVINASGLSSSTLTINTVSGQGLGACWIDPTGTPNDNPTTFNIAGLWYLYMFVTDTVTAPVGSPGSVTVTYSITFNSVTVDYMKTWCRIVLTANPSSIVMGTNLSGFVTNSFVSQPFWSIALSGSFTSTNFGSYNLTWTNSNAGNAIRQNWACDGTPGSWSGINYQTQASTLVVSQGPPQPFGCPDPVGIILTGVGGFAPAASGISWGPWPSFSDPNLELANAT